MRTSAIIVCLALLFVSCSRDDGPRVPGSVELLFPENNSECITGILVGQSRSEVEFRWQQAKGASSYELSVSRIGSNIVERVVTANTTARIVLDRGAPYTWRVIPANASGAQGPISATWQFYNAGAALSYPPFPATIVSPAQGTSVLADGSGQVLLRWSGADADGDLEGFEVFFGSDAADLQRIATPGSGVNSLAVDVSNGVVYFWEVLSRDREGNTSRSGVFSFRAL